MVLVGVREHSRKVASWRRWGGWAGAAGGSPSRRQLCLHRTHQGRPRVISLICARVVWCAGNGRSYFDPDLRGMDVHHINGDSSDDRLANLELVHAATHRHMHHHGTVAGSPRSRHVASRALHVLGGHFSRQRAARGERTTARRTAGAFVICSATDKRSGGSVIAASKLAKRTGLSEGHCRRMVAELLAGGWLTVSKVGHNRNKYTIAAELPAIGVRAGARSVCAPARGSVRAGARTNT